MRAPQLLGALLVILAGAATADMPSHDVYCGEDYWFEAGPPPGWEARQQPGGESVSVIFNPASGASDRSIRLLLPLDSSGAEIMQVDLDRVLLGWVSLATAFAPQPEIRDLELAHPTLPSRAVHLRAGTDHVYLVAVDTGSPWGHTFVLNLASSGAAASAADLAALRDLVGSLRFDPERACASVAAPDGSTGQTPMAVPAAQAPAPR